MAEFLLGHGTVRDTRQLLLHFPRDKQLTDAISFMLRCTQNQDFLHDKMIFQERHICLLCERQSNNELLEFQKSRCLSKIEIDLEMAVQ